MKVAGDRVRVRALNLVGLQRAGVKDEEIEELKRVYNLLFRRKTALSQVLPTVEAAAGSLAEELIGFVREWTSSPAGRYLEHFRTDRPAPPSD
jgi:acyl-[acyl carrier protein]--UDP-N-acetylglucosamine O-acyltransferase